MQSVARDTYREPYVQLRALYTDLLRNQSHFDEFKHLLALYHPNSLTPNGTESASAREVRDRLNARIQGWLSMPIDALSPAQVLQWRSIVVEERFGSGHASRNGFGAY